MTINSASIISIMAFNVLFVGSLSIYFLSKRDWSAEGDNDKNENDDDYIVEDSPAVDPLSKKKSEHFGN